MSNGHTSNVDRINAIYAAFGRGDIASIIEMTAEDVDWGYEGLAKLGPLEWCRAGRGRAKVMEYFRGAGASMTFHAFEPKLVLGQGDDVLALCVVDFTAKATNKRLKVTEAMHFTFDDRGRITRYRLIMDTAERVSVFTD
jgi:uncharacterized protein